MMCVGLNSHDEHHRKSRFTGKTQTWASQGPECWEMVQGCECHCQPVTTLLPLVVELGGFKLTAKRYVEGRDSDQSNPGFDDISSTWVFCKHMQHLQRSPKIMYGWCGLRAGKLTCKGCVMFIACLKKSFKPRPG